MKAYIVHDEESATVVFATNNAVARRDGGSELGGGWEDVESCRRAPEFDQHAPGPVPASALLANGWWLECSGCSERVDEDDAEDMDDDGFWFVKEPVTRGTRTWCCARCQAIDFAGDRMQAAGQAAVVEMVLARYPETIVVTHAYAGSCPGAHWNTGEWEATFRLPHLTHAVRWTGKDPTHAYVARCDIEQFMARYSHVDDGAKKPAEAGCEDVMARRGKLAQAPDVSGAGPAAGASAGAGDGAGAAPPPSAS